MSENTTFLHTYPFPGLWGWIGTAIMIVGFDTWAIKRKKTTMSRTFWYYKDHKKHPILFAGLVGGWCWLTYHLLLEDYRRQLKIGN